MQVAYAFLNIGVFGIDFRYEDQKILIGKKYALYASWKSGDDSNVEFWAAMGTKLQFVA